MRKDNEQPVQHDFEQGQKVTTPLGPGVVLSISGERITVTMASGERREFTTKQITDDSDAG
jgi:hypothetical protein